MYRNNWRTDDLCPVTLKNAGSGCDQWQEVLDVAPVIRYRYDKG